MTQYIDKSALVAEIERTYNFHKKRGGKHDASICDVLYGLLHRINTLEVKEVDEEPVSEDLKAACEQLAEKARKHKAETKSPFFSPNDYKQGVIDGAKWKEEQFEKERLKQCDELTPEQAQIESDFVIQHIKKNKCTPTFIDAIEYGMKLQKEQDKETIELAEDHAMLAGMNKMEQQMIEKAIDGKVCAVYPSAKYNEVQYSVHYPVGVLPHKYGDKVKLIVVKEE